MNTYRVGLAKPVHLHVLPAIERAAALMFPDDVISPEARASTVSEEELCDAQEQRRLWVATTGISIPVGFAIAAPFEDGAFLREIDVHPMHQRNGLGKLLVRSAIDWARAEGYPHISLTTFEHLPWNAPFYARMGFHCLSGSELPQALARKLQEEKQRGLKQRVAMCLRLQAAHNSPAETASAIPGADS